MKKFKHKTAIQIRFKDIDALNHVNNANHITYLELARVNYLDDILGKKINWLEQGIILAKITVDFKEAILFADKIFVYTKCIRLGNKSFELGHSIVRRGKGKETELATGSAILVCYDYKKNQSIPIPALWRKKLAIFEK